MKKSPPKSPETATRTAAPVANRSYAGRSSAQRSQARRQLLLEAAIDLYGTSGYRAATVKAVCQKAGLTERYFYESFESSEVLLCDACSLAMQNMRILAVQAADATVGTKAERILAATQSYFSAIKANPAAARLTLLEVEGVSPYADERLRQELAKTTDMIFDLLYADLPERETAELSSRLLAHGILGALYQLAKEWTYSNFEIPVEILVRHMYAIGMGTLQQLESATPLPARPA